MAESRINMINEINTVGNAIASGDTIVYIDYAYRGILYAISPDAEKDALVFVSSNSAAASLPGRVYANVVHAGSHIAFDTSVYNQLKITTASTSITNVAANLYSIDFSSANGIAPYVMP